ncbi:Hydroxyacid oxidase 1 [Holothuria leucospilota]|uniref:(S)-2-hydroxy-acid oxidase n=1 Tax=Holothuria leucospilota TaxID=206669 RepID=A0A9Q1HCV8_HOLLE|nr:Hydroxyacid oxidase 1 [Holothuria leucospilota]
MIPQIGSGWRLRPRALRDVTKLNLATTVLGHPISLPICFSPTATQGLAHIEKEVASARAGKRCGTLMTLSATSSTRIEKLRSEVPNGLFWMQTYLCADKRATLSFIRRAEENGYKALVVTVDSSGLGRQSADFDFEEEMRKLKENPNLSISFRAVNYDNDFTETNPDDKLLFDYATEQINGSNSSLEELKWLRSVTSLPIILKGILKANVAKRAVQEGVADGILVSAHGGRQLDGVPAPIDVLRDVVDAVRGYNVEVYMDGGIRTGTDVMKALALGAKAVFIGRAVLWGLAVNGEEGVYRVVNLLKEELSLAMKLCGVSRVEDISPSYLIHESSYLSANL